MFNECNSACEPVCGEDNDRPCIEICIIGCGCREGFQRLFQNSTTCVRKQDCPGTNRSLWLIAEI